jgi:prepilin-type N-terminal cleavage/methylation domain-containing protein
MKQYIQHKMKQKKQQGFTLIELLLYMGIFTILLVILLELFTSMVQIQLESQTTSSVTADGRFILNRLSYDIQRSQNVLLPASLGQSGTSLQITGASTNFTYTLSNNNLMLTDNTTANTDKINSNDTSISSLTFTRLGNINGKNTIMITLTVKSVAVKESGPQTESFETTSSMR